MRTYTFPSLIAALVLSAMLAAPGCAERQAPPATIPAATATPPVPAQAPAAEAGAARLPDSVAWVRTAVEFRATAVQAYRLATAQLERALADPSWTAALEQGTDFAGKPPAVIVDADETVLDNSEFEVRRAARTVPYTEADWHAWCREAKATAVPGALEFAQAAQARGVTIFYVTNRQHVVEDATRKNLSALGFPVDATRDTVLTRNEQGWAAPEKSPRRELVARDFRVLLLIGDDFGDFAAGVRTTLDARRALAEKHADMWGVRWIVLPNPMYGSWKTAAGM